MDSYKLFLESKSKKDDNNDELDKATPEPEEKKKKISLNQVFKGLLKAPKNKKKN